MFLKRFRGLFSTDLSIDLGTANTLIYARDKGIVLNEPSVVAIRTEPGGGTKSIAAVGDAAKSMLGRTPGNIQAIRPLKDGVIADFTVTEKMLQHFIHRAHENSFLRPSPRVLVCVPCGSTQVERRAIRESAAGAGARGVYLMEEPMAAAIGAGLPVSEARGSMVLDIGGGTTEVAVILAQRNRPIRSPCASAATVSTKRSSTTSAETSAPSSERRRRSGSSTRSESAYPSNSMTEIEVRGRNLAEGIPRSFVLNSNEILESLQEPLSGIVTAVKTALEQTPPRARRRRCGAGHGVDGRRRAAQGRRSPPDGRDGYSGHHRG